MRHFGGLAWFELIVRGNAFQKINFHLRTSLEHDPLGRTTFFMHDKTKILPQLINFGTLTHPTSSHSHPNISPQTGVALPTQLLLTSTDNILGVRNLENIHDNFQADREVTHYPYSPPLHADTRR